MCGGGGWDLEKLTLQDSRLVGISKKTGFEDSAPNSNALFLVSISSILQVSEGRSLTQGLVVLYPRSIKKIKMDFKQDRHISLTLNSPTTEGSSFSSDLPLNSLRVSESHIGPSNSSTSSSSNHISANHQQILNFSL